MSGRKEQDESSSETGPTYAIFGKNLSPEDIVAAMRAEGRRQVATLATLSVAKSTAVRAGVGELDICALCDSSPHSVACSQHSDFDDDRISYALMAAPDEVGPASYWVNDTFAAAAREAGLDDRAALVEGIGEFAAALKRAELKRARSG